MPVDHQWAWWYGLVRGSWEVIQISGFIKFTS
jgi:hypothetical protein